MPYQKSNMIYDDYVWSTKYNHDDPRVTGEPDSSLLSRREGWEMLYFINKCASKWGWPENIAAMQRLEVIIKEKIPTSIRSQAEVYKWIQNNYKEI